MEEHERKQLEWNLQMMENRREADRRLQERLTQERKAAQQNKGK